ncbi:hypothetical protein SAMN05518865_12346 [Duganella sp. CF458]|uniref:hypothetical protein n=1 Tax=Duganella sp. CF458 TaxID=1884368 RepID=UPI0008E48856|nr:hypothetical protein [Duganella sp. CF458]SFG92590.1 hypothetical protein SAMN05518865_12346 [Duganella sp. CF458]
MPDSQLFGALLPNLDAFWLQHGEKLKLVAEVFKIVGAGASFFAVWKLKAIEKRYLFRATIPGLMEKIDGSLVVLNAWLGEPEAYQTQLTEALNHLWADTKSARRRTRGDANEAAESLIAAMRRGGIEPRFWQVWIVHFAGAPSPSREAILDIFGKASGLVRTLENELDDATWSNK